MGCFTGLKSKKKRQTSFVHRIEHIDHSPTALPEPKVQVRSLQSAPSSFRIRVKPVQPVGRNENNRSWGWSASSSFNDHDMVSSAEYGYHEEMRSRGGSLMEQRPPSPQPLPLPSPHVSGTLNKLESFKSGTVMNGPLYASGPLPLPPLTRIRHFSFEEISAACHSFYPDQCMSEGVSSTTYKASFGEQLSSSRKLDATVSRLHSSSQSLKDFINEVNTLASLQHPNLCKLLGYHARDGSENRMLVYERLSHGSLDNLLYGRSDSPPLDWTARMKVALCAAQGLAFLHEEGPFQAMYTEFSTANIQIDKDFSAKLSGYGCGGHVPEAEISNGSASLPLEMLDRGLVTPKSNVWSFGIILLELITGRKNLDNRHPKEEMNLIKWSRPFLSDDQRLTLIMDPQLKGRYHTKAGRTVADLIQRCLQKDPSERPTMRIIVEGLKTIQDIKYPARYPLQEPFIGLAKRHIARSPSLSLMIATPAPKTSLSPSPPSRTQYPASYTHLSAPLPMSLPPRACSSLSLTELDQQESRKSSTSIRRRPSVEGF